MVVRRLLNLNEVRHLRDFLDFSEKLPYALPTDKSLRHHVLSLNRSIRPEPWDSGLRPRRLAQAIEAIKATLQMAAIHRDRRDRRQITLFSAIRHQSPNLLLRAPRTHLVMAGHSPSKMGVNAPTEHGLNASESPES
ncbi:MAG TPA: hypothetical protein VGG27_08290, partial [Magnetospirillaceae bacterium]